MSREMQERSLTQRTAEKKAAWAAAVAARDEKLADMRRLTQESRAVLDKATAQKRAATAAEEAQLADLDTRCEALEPEISRLNAAAALAEQEYMALPTSVPVGRSMPVDNSTFRGGPSHMETATQHAARAGAPMLWDLKGSDRQLQSRSLSRGENLAEAFAPPSGPRPSPGKMIIGSLRQEFPREWEIERRAVQVGDNPAGGFVVPDAMGQMIQLAEPNSVILQAGAEVMEAPAFDFKLGRLLSLPTPGWYGELPTEITASDPTFGIFELVQKTLAVRTLCSVQWIEDALNGPQLMEQALAQSLGLAWDYAVLNGIAAQGYQGLRQYTGINEVVAGANGAHLTAYTWFVQAIQKVLEGNYAGRVEDLTMVSSPRTWGTIEGLTEATTNAPLAGPASYNALRKLVSTQVPINEVQGSAQDASTIYVGDFRKVLVAMRSPIRVEITREGGDAWKRLGVEVRAYTRLDWAFVQPAHFTRIIGVTVA